MIPYQLNTGKTIFLTFEQWDNLTDEKLQEYISRDSGYFIEDPFKETDFKEFEPKKYAIPNVDDYVEPLDEDSINEIKKQINDDEI